MNTRRTKCSKCCFYPCICNSKNIISTGSSNYGKIKPPNIKKPKKVTQIKPLYDTAPIIEEEAKDYPLAISDENKVSSENFNLEENPFEMNL